MIKTFKSTGIGNESPFDAEEARKWRRLKEESRRAFEERRRAGAASVPRASEGRPEGAGDDGAGTQDP